MKKNGGQSSQHGLSIHADHDQVEAENGSSSRSSESGRERRPSVGETGKRKSRSREKDKTFLQDPPLFPDVIGTEGLLCCLPL